MAKDVRERMVAGATKLLASKGLQATSFSEVIELTDTPRGSIYHHFPGGKDEMVLAALTASNQRVSSAIEDITGKDAAEVLDHVVAQWRGLLDRNDCSMGCAVVAVTVATDSPELLASAGTIFATWQERLTAAYQAGGLDADKAASFAAMTLATIEGGVVFSRAQRSVDGYENAVRMLPEILKTLR